MNKIKVYHHNGIAAVALDEKLGSVLRQNGF